MMRTLLLSLVLLVLAGCSSDTPAEYLARAQDAIGRSDYAAAGIELKNALRLEPDSAQARWLLGKVYLATGDMPSAAKELQRALHLGWSANDVQPALAAALLAQGEYEKVRVISATGLGPEALGRVLAMQAQAAMAMGDPFEAEELVDKALAKTPESPDALLARARLLAGKNDLDGANAALDRIIELDPRQGQAWSLRGDILASRQDLQGALAAYSKAISLNQQNYRDLVKRALLQVQLGDYAAAQADARLLLGKSAKDPAANYIQGLLHFQAGRYADAITALALAEPAAEQYPLALFVLASANLKEGHTDLATSEAERFHALQPGSVQGRELLATLRLQQGDYAAVLALLQPVLDSQPENVDALNLTTNALLRQGRIDEGIELLSRVAQLQPDSPGAQIRLGAGLLIGGKGEDAARHMETALQLDPQFELADILLVLNHLQEKDYPAAIAAAEAYQGRHPGGVTPLNLLGKVYQEADKPEQARATFQRTLALDPADPAANHYLAQMALADNDVAGARKRYETALAGHPESVPTLLQLALLDAREGDEAALVAHLEQAKAADPASIMPRVLLARFYLAKGKPEQVAPLFATLDAQQKQLPDVLQVLAMAQLSTRDASAAQFTLEQLLKATPDSAPIRHAMAMAASGMGDNKRAKEELLRAVALDENYVLARVALARMALAEGSAQEFDDQLQRLTALAPDNPDVLLLRAAAERGQGNMDAALALADKAFKVAPATGTLVSLGTYQEAAGKPDAARQGYTAWLQEYPDDITARMALANSLQSARLDEQASAQYTTILEGDPNNLMALNNQAWILREKNPARALELARKAATIAPDSPEVLDTLAVVEFTNRDYRRAQRSIERALAARPDQPSLLYHSAMIAAALDDKAAARDTLEKLLATNSDFPELAEAKALLATLGN
ncbi:MAG: PEP-CTERM system TPR-repeat protein PrsT [Halioglobus sp.]